MRNFTRILLLFYIYFIYLFIIILFKFQVVKKYFCIQSTSCSAERTFSTGGSTVTTKRTKLDPVNVNMLVYLRENMNKIKLEKLILEDKDEEEIEKECNPVD